MFDSDFVPPDHEQLWRQTFHAELQRQTRALERIAMAVQIIAVMVVVAFGKAFFS